jgi:hypothetical protein
MHLSISKPCYQCGSDNPEQAFCGACGSPLHLNDFISTRVKEQVADVIRDRDVLETESSIKVFERALGWLKIVGSIAVALLAIVGIGVIWKASDWWSGVDKAKQAVIDTSNAARTQIERSASRSVNEITKAVAAANQSIGNASAEVTKQSQELGRSVLQTKAEMSRETASVRTAIESSRSHLQAASKLQPEMEAMRKQLTQATSDIQAQQKVISSSEEFVKSVFSSHVVEFFNIGKTPKDRYAVVPPPKGSHRTLVFLLLHSAPIQKTVQLQYHVFTQPLNSYATTHNLVLFVWDDPLENLQTYQLS